MKAHSITCCSNRDPSSRVVPELCFNSFSSFLATFLLTTISSGWAGAFHTEADLVKMVNPCFTKKESQRERRVRVGMAEAGSGQAQATVPRVPQDPATAGIGASQGTGDGGGKAAAWVSPQLSQHLLWLSVLQPLGLVAQLGAVG